MNTALHIIKDGCLECLWLNGSVFFIVYAALVFYTGIAYDRRLAPAAGAAIQPPPDLSKISPAIPSVQTMILQFLARFLTPRNYLVIIRRITKSIGSATGINKAGYARSILRIFIFYYIIVLPLAAAMLPTNFEVKYDIQSIFALFLMMLTNAVGDYISIKITLNNVKRLFAYNRTKLKNDTGMTKFGDGLKAEASLYLITLFDMFLALLVLLGVLVLTSIYFGVSIGEYKFELSSQAIAGATDRILNFWATSFEPYSFREMIYKNDSPSWPMLFVYSVSSFVPTMLILSFALFWTLMMPLRIIYHTDLNRYLKVIFSELTVFAICATSISAYTAVF